VRIVVFTGSPDIEDSVWWPIVLGTPGLEAILTYRKLPRARAGAWRRFRSNIRKHGPLWIPYRIGYAAAEAIRHLTRPAPIPAAPPPTGISVETIETSDLALPETLARVAAWRPDLGVSLGAPILKPAVFSLPARGTINLHQGKVPDFRGAPPGFWELMTSAPEIGATVHWVDAGLDTGRIIAAATAPLYERDTLRTAQARAEELGRRVLAEALRLVAAGPVEGVAQPAGGRTFRIPLLKQRMALAARLAWRRAARALTPRALSKGALSLLALGVYRPVRDLIRAANGTHPLRVFNFHRVTHLCRDGMTIAPNMFARQLDYIRRYHDIVSLDDALDMARSGRRLRRPAALITFDDGYLSVWEAAWPAMRARRMVGCCFIPTALVGTETRLPHDDANPVRALLGLMRWSQVKALHDAGWAIGAHSATHARLSALSGAALRREVDGALATLREHVDGEQVAMAYPYGGRADISTEARERIRDAGYAACFNDVFGENALPANLYDLRRIELGGDHETLAWKRHVHGISFDRRRGA
jgi:peptidoglycan/xylan/chitin deacetylase (PgdA/CDA1 family)